LRTGLLTCYDFGQLAITPCGVMGRAYLAAHGTSFSFEGVCQTHVILAPCVCVCGSEAPDSTTTSLDGTTTVCGTIRTNRIIGTHMQIPKKL